MNTVYAMVVKPKSEKVRNEWLNNFFHMLSSLYDTVLLNPVSDFMIAVRVNVNIALCRASVPIILTRKPKKK